PCNPLGSSLSDEQVWAEAFQVHALRQPACDDCMKSSWCHLQSPWPACGRRESGGISTRHRRPCRALLGVLPLRPHRRLRQSAQGGSVQGFAEIGGCQPSILPGIGGFTGPKQILSVEMSGITEIGSVPQLL